MLKLGFLIVAKYIYAFGEYIYTSTLLFMDIMFIIPFFAFPFFIAVHLFYELLLERPWFTHTILRVIEVLSIIVLPVLFLLFSDSGSKNNCCTDDVFFSPSHRLTLYVLIVACVAAYFYSSFRKNIASPLLEITINCLLMIGIAINIAVGFQNKEIILFALTNLPIILLFILALIKNQRAIIKHLECFDYLHGNIAERAAWAFLRLPVLIKLPLLMLLCLPVVFIITTALLLFGQKPDSVIRAFTDTYHLGLSQLNSECDNVNCGGHYLCSVAANGHANVVKPKRMGVRAGGNIICNRQLLISNAFEELLQEKLPFLHKSVRRAYNRVGNCVHKYYGIFNNKFVADAIYILMKPAEWFFITTLYMFDSKPENRIAKQYLSKEDRLNIENKYKH